MAIEVLYTVSQTGGDVIAPYGRIQTLPSSGAVTALEGMQLVAIPVRVD